jgi:hypothetical protein
MIRSAPNKGDMGCVFDPKKEGITDNRKLV